MRRCLKQLACPILLGASVLSLPANPALGQTDAQQPFPPSGSLVDIGGYRLHLHCSGQGSPTVVLEAGAGDFSFDWSLVQPAIARVTRVCSYDRAGYAWSAPGPTPRTIRQITAELGALLTNAGIAPPYVLVGHSLGGLYVRVFADEHPGQVRGMVLVAASHEDNPIMLNGKLVLLRSLSRGRQIPPPRLTAPARDSASASEAPATRPPPTLDPPYDQLTADIRRVRIWAMQQASYTAARSSEFDYLAEEVVQVHEQRAANSIPLGSMPLVVLTQKDAPPDNARLQGDLLRLSTDSKQEIAATRDHHIQLGDPGAVIAAVAEVVRAVRDKTRLARKP